MALGKHLFADFYYCGESLEYKANFSDLLLKAIKSLDLTTNALIYHNSQSHEIYMLLIASNIHLTIYIFPEKDYLSIDILAISNQIEPEILFEKLVDTFHPQVTSYEVVLRGTHIN